MNSIKTISYCVNSSEFNKGISSMRKNLTILEQELKNNAKEVENSGNKIDSLAKKQSTIQTAIQQTKAIMEQYSQKLSDNTKKLEQQQKKLSELEKSRANAKATYEDLVKTQGKEAEATLQAKDNYDKLDQQYKNTEKSIENTKKAIQGNVSEITKLEGKQLDLESQLKQTAKAIDDEADKFAKASKNFAESGERFQKAGGKISEVSGDVATIGGAIVTACAGFAKLASSAETGFVKVNTLAKDSGEHLEGFKDSVYDLSDDTGQTVEDLTNGIYDAISAGVEYGDSIKFMDDMNKMAVGGFGDINDAVSAMTSLMNIYGYSVDEVGGVSDKLFTAQEKGVLTVGQLSGVLGESASSAKAYNVDLDNLLAGYVSLTKAGINVEQSNTKISA